jgi:hypothetical protein
VTPPLERVLPLTQHDHKRLWDVEIELLQRPDLQRRDVQRRTLDTMPCVVPSTEWPVWAEVKGSTDFGAL